MKKGEKWTVEESHRGLWSIPRACPEVPRVLCEANICVKCKERRVLGQQPPAQALTSEHQRVHVGLAHTGTAVEEFSEGLANVVDLNTVPYTEAHLHDTWQHWAGAVQCLQLLSNAPNPAVGG